jgi:hypothetical protein
MSPDEKYTEKTDHGRVIYVPAGMGVYVFPLQPGDVDVDYGTYVA